MRHTSFPVPEEARGASAAMGNFDGVHRGHQAVIDLARGRGPLAVVTFEPHPREHFGHSDFRLMRAEARADRLARLGVAHVFEVPFDAALAALSPEAFVDRVLHRDLGLAHVVVGADFCFGAKRAGDTAALRSLCAARGIDVTVAPLVEDGGVISSSAIRQALTEGRPEDAAAMLGHWHRIQGRVAHGEKRGRELGFPTANLPLEGLHLPRFGVYAATVDILDGPFAGRHRGAASLGVRPQFGGLVPNLETFLLDFSGDLYGAEVSVGLVAFLRPEVRFDGVDALVAQMGRDVEEARARLVAAGL